MWIALLKLIDAPRIMLLVASKRARWNDQLKYLEKQNGKETHWQTPERLQGARVTVAARDKPKA